MRPVIREKSHKKPSENKLAFSILCTVPVLYMRRLTHILLRRPCSVQLYLYVYLSVCFNLLFRAASNPVRSGTPFGTRTQPRPRSLMTISFSVAPSQAAMLTQTPGSELPHAGGCIFQNCCTQSGVSRGTYDMGHDFIKHHTLWTVFESVGVNTL